MATFTISTGVASQTWKAIFKNSTNQYWRIATAVFEAYSSTNWGNSLYFLAMTEGRAGEYSCTIPAGVEAVVGAGCLAFAGSTPAASAVPDYIAELNNANVVQIDGTAAHVTKLAGLMGQYTVATAELDIDIGGVVLGDSPNNSPITNIGVWAQGNGGDPVALQATLLDLPDAVWDEATSGHATAGTTGKALTDGAVGGGDATLANQLKLIKLAIGQARTR